MAYGAAIVAIAGAVIGAYGTYQQGRAQEAMFESQADANEYNAIVNEQNATLIAQQAGAKEDAQRRKNRAIIAEMRATGAQNTGLTGTTVGVIDQSAGEAELDALNIRYGGMLESRRHLQQAELQRFEAKANRVAGKAAKRNATISSAASILSSFGGMYGGGGTGGLGAGGG
jgi:hypothetical protein